MSSLYPLASSTSVYSRYFRILLGFTGLHPGVPVYWLTVVGLGLKAGTPE